jgi:lactate dehydrogenase-like 2-hydroxyacid dehydrogenase
MIIYTSRGALVDASAVVEALKTGQVGAFGLDVYEQEADVHRIRSPGTSGILIFASIRLRSASRSLVSAQNGAEGGLQRPI